jgi:hypothetical protein
MSKATDSTTPIPTRRALLSAAPAAAAAALAGGTVANAVAIGMAKAAGADAELLDLCRRTIEQSERHAEADLIQDRLHAELDYKGPFRPELEDRAEAAKVRAQIVFDHLRELYLAVTNTPALTNEGIYAKATVVFGACWGGQHLEDLEDLMTTFDAKVALSMVRDLINGGQA